MKDPFFLIMYLKIINFVNSIKSILSWDYLTRNLTYLTGIQQESFNIPSREGMQKDRNVAAYLAKIFDNFST